MRFSSVAVAALASGAWATPHGKPESTGNPTATASDPADVYAAQATAITKSRTSKVPGKVFDRYVSIWFENTDYDKAAADPNFKFFMEKGITLTNNLAVTHPSEPNYMAVAGGDYFGLDNDPFTQVPQNISSIVDLLEDKGISWAAYQEDMPYTGYQGFDWVNQETGANDYVRKHNPPVLYNSIDNKQDRLENIKNTTLFFEDLKNEKLPQWMFITPNMTSDGHDTSVTVAGVWLRSFLEPLLDSKCFMDRTLVMITFDENETYTIQNRVLGILLGDAVPEKLVGTTDDNYYNHYSELATVEANWDLHTLGRYDVGANVFANVAAHTGDKLRAWSGEPALADRFFNTSYPGIFNTAGDWAPQPVPNVHVVHNGRTVLPSIRAQWAKHAKQTIYDGKLETPDGAHPPVYPQ